QSQDIGISDTLPSTDIPPPLSNSNSSLNRPISPTTNPPITTKNPVPHVQTFLSKPTNSHAMQTRAKSGIVLPRQNPTLLLTNTEPKTVKQALQDPNWYNAMKEEFDALQKNQTWSLVSLPPNRKAIGCKWVFRTKENPDGSINKLKARLVAKGFHQLQGFDFNETFSPVIKPVTIRLILSLAISYKWSLKQLDINNAFLNGSLDEEVYMVQPQGSSTSLVQNLVNQLNSIFSLKQLGDLDYFLGIEVKHLEDGSLLLTQSNYKLSKVGSDNVADATLYRSVVGSLQYATITRPEISFAVNKVCQFMSAPLEAQWVAVKRILRYLKGTSHLGLKLIPTKIHHPLTKSLLKQQVVARSSTEAEYRSLAQATADVLWVQTLLKELTVPFSTPTIYCDNQSAVLLAHNPVLHSRTQHMEIDVFFVREKVLAKQLTVVHIPGTTQIADVLTKPVSTDKFLTMRSKLNVKDSQ
ncbi:histone deacetylase, partial [Trifolium medium]|nr:histone deacetylase [Trifolium medium]